LKRLQLIALASAALGLASCRFSSSRPELRPEERALADLYVQITRIEAQRVDLPDSVGPTLDRLAHGVDSTFVRRALDHMREDPARWALVYDEITRQLRALEESPKVDAEAPAEPVAPRSSD
jgi:hypothetical protein